MSRSLVASLVALAVLIAAASPPLRAEQPAATTCPAAPVAVLPLPALIDTIAAGEPVRIVALGSSSTAGVGASAPRLAYPAQLEARLSAALPHASVRVWNRGVGGEDAAEMLARLDEDVIALQPTLVIWQVGVNAAIRRQSPERFAALLADGIARIKASGADVILMDSQRGPWARHAPDAPAFDAALAEAARRDGVALFSRGRLMDGWQARGAPPGAMLVADGLHHNDRGYTCLSIALTEAILAGLPRTTAAR